MTDTTEETSRIDRADIGEANIATLHVGDIKTSELARIANEVAQQGKQSKTLLESIARSVSSVSAATEASSAAGEVRAVEEPRKDSSRPDNANSGTTSTTAGAGETQGKTAKSPPKRQISASELVVVKPIALEVPTAAPAKTIKGDNQRQIQKEHDAPRPAGVKVVNPNESRKNRTINIGEIPTAPVAEAKATPAKVATSEGGQQADKPAPAGDPPRSAGFYLGDDGRVRRPDGKFATKVESRRFTKEQSAGGDKEASGGDPAYKHSLPLLLARAIGTMVLPKGRSGSQAGEVAGVATGGSFFLAAKEMAEIARDAKEAMKERGIQGKGDITPYLKKQFASLAAFNPLKRKAENSNSDTPQQQAPVPPKKAPGAATGSEPKSAVANQQDKQAAQLTGIAGEQSKQSESQHDAVIKKLDDLIDAVKPKGPGLVDSALDAGSDLFDWNKERRKGKGRGRTKPRVRGRGRFARMRAGMGRIMSKLPSISSASSRSGGALLSRGAVMGATRVAAAGGGLAAGGAAMAASGGVKAATGGASMVASGGAKAAAAGGSRLAGRAGLAVGGRLAGAIGVRAIPLVGQAIALGLAAKDGYDGYTDTEGQKRAFGIKDDKEVTTGQKSAMAAARVLDLGGITSGVSGLLGSAAGAMGFEKLQEALTFDSDDMARAIYEGMNLFDRLNPSDPPKNMTINNMGSSGITQRGITDGTGDWKGTPLKFSGTEAESGLPDGYLSAALAVESGGNWNAVNGQSGAMGGWQFMPKTAAGLGLSASEAFDPEKSTRAMITHTQQNQDYFRQNMGREATGRELYLLHQQGMGGGTKLLQNPNASAASLVGNAAVLQNGGRADMTSQEFVNMILNKYDRAEAANRANPGKAIDMDAVLGTKKPEYNIPAMLRGGPQAGEEAPPLIAPSKNAAPVTAAADPRVPAALRMPTDIQVISERNALTERGDKKPYAPGADTDTAMLGVLKSIDKSLKDQGKKSDAKAPSGGPLRSGGKPSVSSHPTMAGPMADFANDRR